MLVFSMNNFQHPTLNLQYNLGIHIEHSPAQLLLGL